MRNKRSTGFVISISTKWSPSSFSLYPSNTTAKSFINRYVFILEKLFSIDSRVLLSTKGPLFSELVLNRKKNNLIKSPKISSLILELSIQFSTSTQTYLEFISKESRFIKYPLRVHRVHSILFVTKILIFGVLFVLRLTVFSVNGPLKMTLSMSQCDTPLNYGSHIGTPDQFHHLDT